MAFVRELETQADPFASVVQATESDSYTNAYLSAILHALHERVHVLSEPSSGEYTSALHERCPRRHIRAFRIVRVRDAWPTRRTSRRTAQLSVWGDTDVLEEGGRYEITQLVPTQGRSWRARECVADAFLSTTRDTRYIRRPL